MDASFIATKVRIPPQPYHAVSRSRLIDALEHGVPRCKLTLFSAPAGYGKTTLLSQWAHASRRPVAWVTIRDDDNDVDRFFRYLFAAWEKVQHEIRDSELGLLLSGMMPDRDAVVSAFVNAASEVSDHIVFALDDFHLMTEQPVYEALSDILDNLPPSAHFVMSGRSDPPLPLARYRARGEMAEYRVGELQFGFEETMEFLNRSMALDLPDVEVRSLHEQLEGWVAGLQLSALSIRRIPTLMDTRTISGRHRFIADYLAEDVLSTVPEDAQRFLFQTSILDSLCGELCDAVTGRDDGQEMLERLEQENLFIVPLDENRSWYRYHTLFAEFLRDQLGRRYPDVEGDLHRRASRWHLAHDLPEQAFNHAIAGNDVDLVIQIFERYFYAKLLATEIATLQRWFAALPPEWVTSSPALGLARVGLMMFAGDLGEVFRELDEIEQQISHTQDNQVHILLARTTALRCFIACFQNDLPLAREYADRALPGLSETDLDFRAGIHGALGDTYRANGYWREAKHCYLKVLDLAQAPSFQSQSVHVYGALADLSRMQGHLHEAAGYWETALSIIHDHAHWGYFPLPEAGWVYTRMGELLYEWNELERSWEYVTRGLEYAELSGDVRGTIAGCLIAARLSLTQGDIEAASNYLENARPLLSDAPFPDWTDRFGRLQLEVWLAQDKLRSAVNWADEMERDDAPPVHARNDSAQLAMARVLIVRGDDRSIDQAKELLEHLRQTAKTEGRSGFQIEALALTALAQWTCSDRPGALTLLHQAMRLAEPEGYVRLFADLGLPMARLLQEARSRNIMADYVQTLLAAFSQDVAATADSVQRLPEPLTEREHEILELLAAGLTNSEIAGKLFISPETVKKHTRNIYGKLGVHSRIGAAAKARTLHLLT